MFSPFPDDKYEFFRGIYDLAETAKKTGKDFRVAVSNRLGYQHGDRMQAHLRLMRIPDEKMIFIHPEYVPFEHPTGDPVYHSVFERFFVIDEFYPEADKIRVVGYPHNFPILWDEEWEHLSQFLENTNALHFVAAGNDGEYGRWSPLENDYLFWGGLTVGPQIYRNALRSLGTGKVFIVRTALRNVDGTVVPSTWTVDCNDAADACFTTVQDFDTFSSGASMKMAGLAYYLSHLFDRAEDVAEVLKACSDDLGEPGVDQNLRSRSSEHGLRHCQKC